MTAYGTEFFSMNDVNRLRILQDVRDNAVVLISLQLAEMLKAGDGGPGLSYVSVTLRRTCGSVLERRSTLSER